MGDRVLDLSGVSLSYGALRVVHDLSFSVSAGEIFGLVGVNGAGKTTLIKAILGLRDVTDGTVCVLGVPRYDMRARREVAYLPERFDPPWFLTGFEFIQFSLRLYGVSCNKAAVRESAQALALDPDMLDKRVHLYSKGMRQKLGILGTLLTGCRVVILDEPMSGLDPLARSLVKDMIGAIKSRDQTVVMCSHILADVEEMCPRMAVLHAGRLMFLGAPSALCDQTGEINLERAFLRVIQEYRQDAA